MNVTDSEPNRTEPNPWPQRQGGQHADARARARARVTEVGEGATPTEGEGRQGPPALFTEVREALMEGFDKAWPENAEAVRRYGSSGQQVAPVGVLRTLSVIWAAGPATVATWLHVYRAWVWQRWFRWLSLVGVFALVNLLIPGSAPAWVWALFIGFLL